MKHLLSIEKLTRPELDKVLSDDWVEEDTESAETQPLAGQSWAMISRLRLAPGFLRGGHP
jgi:hypothetical protein